MNRRDMSNVRGGIGTGVIYVASAQAVIFTKKWHGERRRNNSNENLDEEGKCDSNKGNYFLHCIYSLDSGGALEVVKASNEND